MPSGCFMCSGLYIKANCQLPCWDDVGEKLILRKLSPSSLVAGEEQDILNDPALLHIRRSFKNDELPFPNFCKKCAVRGKGVHRGEILHALEVLHVEPSFLCALACPLCISPRERLRVQTGPYQLDIESFRALLRSLKRDGCREITFTHFEGRGDPSSYPGLGEFVQAAKLAYPTTLTTVTTHGNMRLHEWLFSGSLDVLRLSVDGFTQESYARYRVNGRLEKATALMDGIYRASQEEKIVPRVEWKYILFEWNDSAVEMMSAMDFAESKDVQISFCLTHSAGRSKRYRTVDDVRSFLARNDRRARIETTFNLKDETPGSTESVVFEHAESLLLGALRYIERGRLKLAMPLLLKGMRSDVTEFGHHLSSDSDYHDFVAEIDFRAPEIRSPATASALANILFCTRDYAVSVRLFKLYLTLAPTAPDRGEVSLRINGIDELLGVPDSRLSLRTAS